MEGVGGGMGVFVGGFSSKATLTGLIESQDASRVPLKDFTLKKYRLRFVRPVTKALEPRIFTPNLSVGSTALAVSPWPRIQ